MRTDKLKEPRQRIDAIDEQLVKLICERMAISREVGKAKAKQAKEEKGSQNYQDHAREAQIIRAAQKRAGDKVSPAFIERIYREIMSESLGLQRPVRVSHLGPAGTFSQEAAVAHFGHAAEMLHTASISDCFATVARGEADCAVVPYENSTDGGIGETLDLLVTSDLVAVGETQLRIRQTLMVAPGTKPDEIKALYYHPQSFAQCTKWLRANLLPVDEQVSCASNAAAAQKAAAGGVGSSAIGPRGAAEIHGLEVIQSDIEDNPRNVTRFLVLGREPVGPSGDDKTSLIVAVRHEPGSLFALLSEFADTGLNMTRLESRPMPGRAIGDYMFFIDVEGHRANEPLCGLLEGLKDKVSMLRVIGSYPAGSVVG